jgi:hypothetical protein
METGNVCYKGAFIYSIQKSSLYKRRPARNAIKLRRQAAKGNQALLLFALVAKCAKFRGFVAVQ